MPRLRSWLSAHSWLVGVSLFVILGGMAISLLGSDGSWKGSWVVSVDNWLTVDQARYVANGALASVYSADHLVSALPGAPILYAPAVALGDHLGLVEGYPIPVPHPSMWLVIGPVALAESTLAIWGLDALARYLGASALRRRFVAAVVGGLVVVPTVLVAGHPEDLFAVGAVAFALVAWLQGRFHAAAYWLAGAVMFQTWAGLVVIVMLASTGPRNRLAMAWRSLTLPGLTFLVCLAGSPSATLRQVLLVQPMPVSGQHTPWYGLAPRLSGLAQVAGAPSRRWLALAVVGLGVWLWRRRPGHGVVVAAVAAVLLARPLFETSDWGYYLAGGLLLAMAVGAAAPGRGVIPLGLVALAAVAPTYGYLGNGHPIQANPWLFLAGLVVVDGGALLVVIRGLARIGPAVAIGSGPRPSLGDTPAPAVL